MSEPFFARYEDALKLILTGSTSEQLEPNQRGIFIEMLTRGIRVSDRNKKNSQKNKRRLPGVRTKKHPLGHAKHDHEIV